MSSYNTIDLLKACSIQPKYIVDFYTIGNFIKDLISHHK